MTIEEALHQSDLEHGFGSCCDACQDCNDALKTLAGEIRRFQEAPMHEWYLPEQVLEVAKADHNKAVLFLNEERRLREKAECEAAELQKKNSAFRQSIVELQEESVALAQVQIHRAEAAEARLRESEAEAAAIKAMIAENARHTHQCAADCWIKKSLSSDAGKSFLEYVRALEAIYDAITSSGDRGSAMLRAAWKLAAEAKKRALGGGA